VVFFYSFGILSRSKALKNRQFLVFASFEFSAFIRDNKLFIALTGISFAIDHVYFRAKKMPHQK